MTEEEAQDFVDAEYGRAVAERIKTFVAMLIDETGRQNLIAPSTVPHIWIRHVLDSIQLLPLATKGTWLDVGSGGGFPGVVVACVRSDAVILCEPRRKRAEFLERCVSTLDLRNATVFAGKVEKFDRSVDVISARAVSTIDNVLAMTIDQAHGRTRWILPRGRIEDFELDELRRRWKGVFHVEQSRTDPLSTIVVADGVSLR